MLHLGQQQPVSRPHQRLVFNTTQTAVSCNGGADGTITVNVTG
jgi:hypothetical protein